jgi:hypothetical protein
VFALGVHVLLAFVLEYQLVGIMVSKKLGGFGN